MNEPERKIEIIWEIRETFRMEITASELTAVAGRPTSQQTFTLRMDAGGPTGPLVNAMLAPALLPAAEDLANKIAAHLEKVHGISESGGTKKAA